MSLQRSEVRTQIAPIKLQCTLYHGTCIKLRICQQKMHHRRLHELNITKCPLGLAKIFSIFFFCQGLFTLKCSNEEGRVLELVRLCLKIFCFCFRTVRHILVRVKIFPKQPLSQKENHSQLESLLVRHYTTMWECMFI